MKSLWKKLVVVLVGAVVVAGLVFAFIAKRREVVAEAEREQPIKAATRVALVNGENVVSLDGAARTSGGVGLAPLQTIEHRPQISAYGVVVDLGELTDLRNTIANAGAQLAKAAAARDVARKEYERAKGLFDANQNVAEKTVQSTEGAWHTEEANVLAAQAALDAARATAQQRWGRIIAGWLAAGGAEFDRLRRQDELLVQVTLAPSQAGIAAPAEASVLPAGGKLITAKLVSPASRTDPKIQGRSFFYLLPAAGTNLLPGMNVVTLLSTGEPEPGVLVPGSAVVWLQGKAWAYAQVQPDKFARRAVSTEQPARDGWVQPKEFSKGEPFVIRGPQVLLSEEFRAQISVGDEK